MKFSFFFLKKRLKQSEEQLSSYKTTQQTNLELIQKLESQLSQIETEKIEIKIKDVNFYFSFEI